MITRATIIAACFAIMSGPLSGAGFSATLLWPSTANAPTKPTPPPPKPNTSSGTTGTSGGTTGSGGQQPKK